MNRNSQDPKALSGVKSSATEIWCECFGRAKEDMKPADSYAIAALMVRVDGWKKTKNMKRHPIYGKQRVYTRIK